MSLYQIYNHMKSFCSLVIIIITFFLGISITNAEEVECNNYWESANVSSKIEGDMLTLMWTPVD